ncbi:hypothetical protein QWY15_19295 [Planococcus sp. N064]|uniref:Uncharacterized protein n=1 Tax=Planococcus liqunii TaxID=3058394 RepID=A0ABT8MX34_9BACL|nr:hypothetical protein [Planococcus sp. N064]MDN7229411.1 hypothetical protein [Planococcus sp. N064]
MKRLFRWTFILFISAALYPIIYKGSAVVSNGPLKKDQIICDENDLTTYETVTNSEGTQFVIRQTTILEIDEPDVPVPQTEEELIQLARDMYNQAGEGDEIIYVGESTADYEKLGQVVYPSGFVEEKTQCKP